MLGHVLMNDSQRLHDENTHLKLEVQRLRRENALLRGENPDEGRSAPSLTPHEQDRSICRRPKHACRDLGQKLFVPLDAEIAHQHLTGRIVAGVYPLLPDDTCWFLAVDFDKSTWSLPGTRAP